MRSKKTIQKFNDEFYLALAPSIMDKLTELKPYQLNEIFISATRPRVKKRQVNRIMVGLTVEGLKTLAKRLKDDPYNDVEKYYTRNSYYQ